MIIQFHIMLNSLWCTLTRLDFTAKTYQARSERLSAFVRGGERSRRKCKQWKQASQRGAELSQCAEATPPRQAETP